ncbi:unnamed protein product [Amoebophrya sp. A120]|nr:unnamed protein product [Amoebophrya sp. A120]|eukprot:GSA120T00006514001.1
MSIDSCNSTPGGLDSGQSDSSFSEKKQSSTQKRSKQSPLVPPEKNGLQQPSSRTTGVVESVSASVAKLPLFDTILLVLAVAALSVLLCFSVWVLCSKFYDDVWTAGKTLTPEQKRAQTFYQHVITVLAAVAVPLSCWWLYRTERPQLHSKLAEDDSLVGTEDTTGRAKVGQLVMSGDGMSQKREVEAVERVGKVGNYTGPASPSSSGALPGGKKGLANGGRRSRCARYRRSCHRFWENLYEILKYYLHPSSGAALEQQGGGAPLGDDDALLDAFDSDRKKNRAKNQTGQNPPKKRTQGTASTGQSNKKGYNSRGTEPGTPMKKAMTSSISKGAGETDVPVEALEDRVATAGSEEISPATNNVIKAGTVDTVAANEDDEDILSAPNKASSANLSNNAKKRRAKKGRDGVITAETGVEQQPLDASQKPTVGGQADGSTTAKAVSAAAIEPDFIPPLSQEFQKVKSTRRRKKAAGDETASGLPVGTAASSPTVTSVASSPGLIEDPVGAPQKDSQPLVSAGRSRTAVAEDKAAAKQGFGAASSSSPIRSGVVHKSGALPGSSNAGAGSHRADQQAPTSPAASISSPTAEQHGSLPSSPVAAASTKIESALEEPFDDIPLRSTGGSRGGAGGSTAPYGRGKNTPTGRKKMGNTSLDSPLIVTQESVDRDIQELRALEQVARMPALTESEETNASSVMSKHELDNSVANGTKHQAGERAAKEGTASAKPLSPRSSSSSQIRNHGEPEEKKADSKQLPATMGPSSSASTSAAPGSGSKRNHQQEAQRSGEVNAGLGAVGNGHLSSGIAKDGAMGASAEQNHSHNGSENPSLQQLTTSAVTQTSKEKDRGEEHEASATTDRKSSDKTKSAAQASAPGSGCVPEPTSGIYDAKTKDARSAADAKNNADLSQGTTQRGTKQNKKTSGTAGAAGACVKNASAPSVIAESSSASLEIVKDKDSSSAEEEEEKTLDVTVQNSNADEFNIRETEVLELPLNLILECQHLRNNVRLLDSCDGTGTIKSTSSRAADAKTAERAAGPELSSSKSLSLGSSETGAPETGVASAGRDQPETVAGTETDPLASLEPHQLDGSNGTAKARNNGNAASSAAPAAPARAGNKAQLRKTKSNNKKSKAAEEEEALMAAMIRDSELERQREEAEKRWTVFNVAASVARFGHLNRVASGLDRLETWWYKQPNDLSASDTDHAAGAFSRATPHQKENTAPAPNEREDGKIAGASSSPTSAQKPSKASKASGTSPSPKKGATNAAPRTVDVDDKHGTSCSGSAKEPNESVKLAQELLEAGDLEKLELSVSSRLPEVDFNMLTQLTYWYDRQRTQLSLQDAERQRDSKMGRWTAKISREKIVYGAVATEVLVGNEDEDQMAPDEGGQEAGSEIMKMSASKKKRLRAKKKKQAAGGVSTTTPEVEVDHEDRDADINVPTDIPEEARSAHTHLGQKAATIFRRPRGIDVTRLQTLRRAAKVCGYAQLETLVEDTIEKLRVDNCARISLAELKKHRTRESCWVVIDSKVYDVTPFLPLHPGGEDLIVKAASYDATGVFELTHGEGLRYSLRILNQFFIGLVADSVKLESFPDTPPPSPEFLAVLRRITSALHDIDEENATGENQTRY